MEARIKGISSMGRNADMESMFLNYIRIKGRTKITKRKVKVSIKTQDKQ